LKTQGFEAMPAHNRPPVKGECGGQNSGLLAEGEQRFQRYQRLLVQTGCKFPSSHGRGESVDICETNLCQRFFYKRSKIIGSPPAKAPMAGGLALYPQTN